MRPKDLDFEKPIEELERKIEELKGFAEKESIDVSAEIARLEAKAAEVKKEIFENLTPWQRTQVARHPNRPYTRDYIRMMLTGYTELAGDRCYREDRAMIGGFAYLGGKPVMVIGHQKGRDTKENLRRNFGMSHPEGNRKALRLLQMAEKFRLPILTFIDTPGAYPGVGAEERGQSGAIARNLREMAGLKVPIIATVIGEGGSGGALAIGVGNSILMLENAVYYVCTPEACAAILWRDRARAPEAARALAITVKDLKKLGIVDEMVPEPLGGAHRDPPGMARTLQEVLERHLEKFSRFEEKELVEQRYDKYRKMGEFVESPWEVSGE